MELLFLEIEIQNSKFKKHYYTSTLLRTFVGGDHFIILVICYILGKKKMSFFTSFVERLTQFKRNKIPFHIESAELIMNVGRATQGTLVELLNLVKTKACDDIYKLQGFLTRDDGVEDTKYFRFVFKDTEMPWNPASERKLKSLCPSCDRYVIDQTNGLPDAWFYPNKNPNEVFLHLYLENVDYFDAESPLRTYAETRRKEKLLVIEKGESIHDMLKNFDSQEDMMFRNLCYIRGAYSFDHFLTLVSPS
jgi:hypothetical protein